MLFKTWKTLLSLMIGGLLLAFGFLLGSSASPGAASDMAGPVQSGALTDIEQIYSDIYYQASPSVVSITVALERGDSGFVDVSSGSGFVVDELGHIVTNYHVIDENGRIVVSFFDGTLARAEVVGTDPSSDLAVIRVNLPPERLLPLPFADSDSLFVGQSVVAIGNPFSRDWTLTSGIVSALKRTIRGFDRYEIGGIIQTDAALNPGNSGGPLLNLRGEVVGVNSQFESLTRQNSGVGFAIPSNLVARVASELIETGRVRYSYLGVNSIPLTIELIELYDLPNNLRGVPVRQVLPGSPARTAGLQTITPDMVDIITAIDGEVVDGFEALIAYLSIHTRPGETISLTVYRGGQFITLPLTLGERP